MTRPVQFPIPPKAYLIALEHLSQRIGKPIELLTIMAYDLLLEKYYEHTPQPQQIFPPISNLPQQSKNTPIYSSQLEVIPTGTSYGLLLKQDDGYWLDSKPYPTLREAIDRIQEYSMLGYTNLKNWSPMTGEYPVVTLQKIKGTLHLWLGQDTACKMWSTSSMNQSSAYKLTTKLSEQAYCVMCVKNYSKLKNPKLHLVFDEKNKLVNTQDLCNDLMF